MRMRVRFGDAAVRRPARVRNAEPAGERFGRELALELRDLADGAAQAELLIALHDREASRVIAAVLEPLQAFDEHGNNVALCNGADDAAHTLFPWSKFARERRHLGFFFGRRQPEIVTCFERSSVSSPAGVSFVIVEPAPMVAPAPTSTGATSMTPEP